jgi:hypothetical protein
MSRAWFSLVLSVICDDGCPTSCSLGEWWSSPCGRWAAAAGSKCCCPIACCCPEYYPVHIRQSWCALTRVQVPVACGGVLLPWSCMLPLPVPGREPGRGFGMCFPRSCQSACAPWPVWRRCMPGGGALVYPPATRRWAFKYVPVRRSRWFTRALWSTRSTKVLHTKVWTYTVFCTLRSGRIPFFAH